MSVLFVPAGLPPTFAPVPAATPDGATGGTIRTVGVLAGWVPHGPDNGGPNLVTLTDRQDSWSAAGHTVVPNGHGVAVTTFVHPGAELGPGGRTRRYNVDPVPSTSGASVAANSNVQGTPRAPSGPSVATQPWPRVTPVWPVRTRF